MKNPYMEARPQLREWLRSFSTGDYSFNSYLIIADWLVLADCQRDLIRLGAAIHNFQLDHGRMPNKLADLVPRYLDNLPLDRFIGEPYHFKVEPRFVTIYSVGTYLKDDGGKESSPGYSTPDITFTLPLSTTLP